MNAQFGDGNLAGMEHQVRGDDPLCQWISSSEVDHRPERRRGGQITPQYHLVSVEVSAAD